MTTFSAIQPTGIPTLGNYLGALKNWVELSNEHNGIYAIADMHAITVRQNPKEFLQRVRTVFAICKSIGLSDNSTLFIQSNVPAHSELAWILNCYTMFGELGRMTQFKDKSAKNADNINAGLFTYPTLMAADILLYGADFVPVGADQKQHIEIARDIAERFNGIYGDVLVVPEGYLQTAGSRIMSLQDPTRKMDKSDPNPNAYISMLDSRDVIIKKFKKAVTDSDAEVRFDEEVKPGVSNLMTIYSVCTGKNFEEIEKEFAGVGYGAFKLTVGESADAVLSPIREKVNGYLQNPEMLDMAQGAEKARELAAPMLKKVKEAIGFSQ